MGIVYGEGYGTGSTPGTGLTPAQEAKLNALPTNWSANVTHNAGDEFAFGGKIYTRIATGNSGATFNAADYTTGAESPVAGARVGTYRGKWDVRDAPDATNGVNDPITGEALVVGDWWQREGGSEIASGINFDENDVIFIASESPPGTFNFDKKAVEKGTPSVASQGAMTSLPDSPGQIVLRTDFAPPRTFTQLESPANVIGNWRDDSAADLESGAQVVEQLTIVTQDVMPDLANAPRADLPIQIIVEGVFYSLSTEPGFTLAGSTITPNPGTLGFNIDPGDNVRVIYWKA